MPGSLVSLVGSWKGRAVSLLVGEGLSEGAAIGKLRSEGFQVSEGDVHKLWAGLGNVLAEDGQNELVKAHLLDSIDRVSADFEVLSEKTKGLLAQFEASKDGYMQLVVVRELREQLKLALTRLGEYKKAATTMNTQVNIMSGADVVDRFRNMQIAQFEQFGAHMDGERLVFERPSPELVDAYRRWWYAKDVKGRDISDAEFVKR